MATKKRSAFDVDDFRRQSEKRATQNQADLAEYTPKLLRQLICELRVRQTELEMQIEELGCKQMELYASYKRYFDSYQLAPAGLLTLDSQSMIVEANLAFSTLLDVGTGSLAGQKLTSYILPEDQNLYDLYSEQLLATGGSSVWRMRLVNQGGSEIWVRMEATLEGESAIRAVVSDITDRVQEEQSLQERELQFRQLFELSSDALLLIDGECGQIIEANGAAVGLYGYSRDALIGMK